VDAIRETAKLFRGRIAEIHRHSRASYGAPGIHAEVKKQGLFLIAVNGLACGASEDVEYLRETYTQGNLTSGIHMKVTVVPQVGQNSSFTQLLVSSEWHSKALSTLVIFTRLRQSTHTLKMHSRSLPASRTAP
jgi:hypothetical protein